jgi:hypothetical protein
MKKMNIYNRNKFVMISIPVIAALIHGLIYVFLIPAWQHYDEPNHFEYVWLIANQSGMPKPGDYDQKMRRQVAESMIENDFFNGMNFLPDLEVPNDKAIWIGQYSQLHEPPLYYLLASIPLHLINPEDIEIGLILARLVSFSLFIFTVICSWGIITELTAHGHVLRLLIPLTVALIPGFVDLMTSVNNSVGAVFIFSLFLWGSTRMIVRGFSVIDFTWVTCAAVMCYLTKSTVYLALPALGLILLFSVFRIGLWRRFAYSLLVVLGLSFFILAFDWGDALYWVRNPLQDRDTRIKLSTAPSGEHALLLEIEPDMPPRDANIRQIIPPHSIKEHHGQQITLGAWMWASEIITVRLPILMDEFGVRSEVREVAIGTQPTFFATTAIMPENTVRVWVSLEPFFTKVDKEINIFYDGIIVTPGLFPVNETPYIMDDRFESGLWGGVQFKNLIRNGSAEYSFLRVRPWVDNFGMEILPDRGRPSLILYSIFDQLAVGWYYRMSAENLIRTFWAKFGWGHVSLIGYAPYRILTLVSFFGFLVGIIGLIKYRQRINWNVFAFFMIVTTIIWIMTWTRGAIYLFHRTFIPSARYAYPVIIPTILLLVLGWHLISLSIQRALRFPRWANLGLYIGLLIALDFVAIISIIKYYA